MRIKANIASHPGMLAKYGLEIVYRFAWTNIYAISNEFQSRKEVKEN